MEDCGESKSCSGMFLVHIVVVIENQITMESGSENILIICASAMAVASILLYSLVATAIDTQIREFQVSGRKLGCVTCI